MSRRFLKPVFLLVCTCACALAPSRNAPAQNSEAALDLRSYVANQSRVSPGPAAGSLDVTFHPSEWPNLTFKPPGGEPWNWSAHGRLLLDLFNPGKQAIEFGVRIDDDPSADGSVHCRTARGRLAPGESASFAMPLGRDDPMSHGMRGLPEQPGMRRLNAGGYGAFNPAHIVAFQVFAHRPGIAQTLEIRRARLGPSIALDGIVDRFGQFSRADWPGKVHSESELLRMGSAEEAELKAHPAPADRDRFGGWLFGPKQPASGFFRTARVGDRWWLVDPDGSLFVSLGIDVVTMGEATFITGREGMFAGLPPVGDPLERFFATARGVHSGPVKSGRTFNFYEANLARKFGPDFERSWEETTLARLRSWGFNTIGNWSHRRLYRNRQVPYVATVHVSGEHAHLSSGSDYWGQMHDPFDPRFAANVRRSLREVARSVQGDPWCLGYFVDNELSWGGFREDEGRYGLALGALSLNSVDSPAKRAMLELLKGKYAGIADLNNAWGTKFAGWSALEAAWKPADPASRWPAALRSDLGLLVKALARRYFQTVRAELKALDADHLYLGCRFAWKTPEAVEAAAEFCDVVSFNIYARRVDTRTWRFLERLGKPAIVGEFHAGALDRGMFHTGLVAAANQEERATLYREYVESVLDNPALVGCHWFQYVDEPLTGRAFDGENYNIGFVTVTDTPYPELVAAARSVHREAYVRRFGRDASAPRSP